MKLKISAKTITTISIPLSDVEGLSKELYDLLSIELKENSEIYHSYIQTLIYGESEAIRKEGLKLEALMESMGIDCIYKA